MSFADRDGFIVRILHRGSPTRSAGIGFVVGERHIVTCAHVINTALDTPDRSQKTQEAPGPDERVQVEFPILGDAEGAPSRSCRVGCWLPPPKTGVSGGDVAGLMIVGEALPNGAGPARLISENQVRGAEVEVFGYPADHRDRRSGAWVTQRLHSAVGGGIIQLDTQTESAIRAQQGYSGSPVVAADEDGDAVVGMLAIAARDDDRDSYAIPVTQLAAAWPAVLGKPDVLGGAAGGEFSVPAAEQPTAAPASVQQPTAPQPGLQQPALEQVIAGNWMVEIQSPQYGAPSTRMMLTLVIAPFGQLQFQGSFVGVPAPVVVQGLWWVMGNQVKLSGARILQGPWPQQYPYEVIITFASWSYAQLIGVTSAGETVLWHRQS